MNDLQCTCEGVPVITDTERAMADGTGIEPEVIHAFMDVWTMYAEEIVSRLH